MSWEMKRFPDARKTDPILVLLQESWQRHIWVPASQPLCPALPTACAHTGLVRNMFFSFSSCLGGCPIPVHMHICTHTTETFSLLSQPSFPFSAFPFSFIFMLLSLHSFPSPPSFPTCTVTTSELFLVCINSPLIWMEDLKKKILLKRRVYILRLELKEKELSFIKWHSGQRNTHVRILYIIGCT